MSYKIREANELDIDHIFQFILKKAEFDRNLGDSLGLVTTNKEIIRKTMFNDHPYAKVLLAIDTNNLPIGIAIYHFRYSSFSGLPSVWLDDLYIEPSDRGIGLGKNLMQSLIAIAKENNASDISWIASDLNESAKKFYDKIGSRQIQKNGSTITYQLTFTS
ncbi:GNAT family N-acetyltransferase [Leptospira levettii]|uniref:GNAT family N-acetyltransferase n=1 Tax=Leptospira levettii TaxID=2023178 RepID=UPI001083941C|nr:GNAT family N-acetyltransferase [Leptospira levettii]TGK99284.1 GNAT family N-acetyltransferase [Leptospira levettii]